MLLSILLSTSAYSESINFCSLDRPNLSESNGTGYYWDLLRAIYQEEGIAVKINSAPFLRCLKGVENKSVDGAVAVFKTLERQKHYLYPKRPLNVSSYGLIYLKETPFDKLENVKNDVGIIRGYDFSEWLPPHISYQTLNSNALALEMLKRKRIVYFADDIQDTLFTLKKHNEQVDQFNYKVFKTKNLYMVLTKDERGQKLADKFDSGLQKIYDNGALQRLIKEYGLTNSFLQDFNDAKY